MAKIDKMLEMMSTRAIERAVLNSDRAFELWSGGQRTEGSVTPGAQLKEVVAEITPLSFASLLENGGSFHFVYGSPFGAFDVGVESFMDTLQVRLSPATPAAPDKTAPIVPAAPPPTPSPTPSPTPPLPPANASAPAFVLQSEPEDSSALAIPPASRPLAPKRSAPGGFVCFTHPQTEAAGVCSYSGKFYCAQCLVEVDGKNYGKENLSYVMADARQKAAPPPPPQVVIQNAPAPHYPHYPPRYDPGIATESPHSRMIGGLLGIFLGVFGIHRFYLGYNGAGVAFLLLTFVFSWISCGLTAMIAGVWGLIEGIVILCGGMKDAQNRPLKP